VRAVRLIETGAALQTRDLDPPPSGPRDVEVRIQAAGMCRSDVHYRAGTRPVPNLPVTPGHEVAGTVASVGSEVTRIRPGDRVAVNYLISCGRCARCAQGLEQFCETGAMIGLSRDGGYAESIWVPERNLHILPETVPIEIAAIMMCSTATSLHALRRGRVAPGETVAVFGCGGLGMSAIKLAFQLGAGEVFAVDIDPDKLTLAEELGARPVDFDQAASVSADVALELVGLPETMRAAVETLTVRGRAVAVGITHASFPLDSFNDLVLREATVVGAADHTASEIDELIAMVDTGALDLSDMVTATIPLEAGAVNAALDRLEAFDGGVRTVIVP
jgi:2-desacetyl-2-hydroxyethyl bacteriochlorophyllide A dehydrogenase